MKDMSRVPYSELLQQVGKYEDEKERLQNKIWEITLEMKRRRAVINQRMFGKNA